MLGCLLWGGGASRFTNPLSSRPVSSNFVQLPTTYARLALVDVCLAETLAVRTVVEGGHPLDCVRTEFEAENVQQIWSPQDVVVLYVGIGGGIRMNLARIQYRISVATILPYSV